VTTLPDGSLMLEDGTVVPVEKRTRCEVYSRTCGYLRPVSQWNRGKKSEWRDRVPFQVKIDSPEVKEGGGSDA